MLAIFFEKWPATFPLLRSRHHCTNLLLHVCCVVLRLKKVCTVAICEKLHAQLKEAAKKDKRALGVFTALLLEEALTARE